MGNIPIKDYTFTIRLASEEYIPFVEKVEQKSFLREWPVKNQPGCSALKRIKVNFFDLAESTT